MEVTLNSEDHPLLRYLTVTESTATIGYVQSVAVKSLRRSGCRSVLGGRRKSEAQEFSAILAQEHEGARTLPKVVQQQKPLTKAAAC